MRDTTPTVICIPAKPEVVLASKHQLRVAAYCRVSTDDEEQLTSYEAQKNYYTDKIMTNKEWTMAGIFADEGITGTSARKRPEFLRMIRQCKQGKIDIVLTKSISRFARNTVDCLNYVRALKELGIAVIFEKENMNTLEIDSEILITMLGAFAQSESESISANVRWGIRQAMKEGKVTIQYKYLYGYRKGDDGKPEIIPNQAEVVRKIYDLFLSGTPVRGIQEYLNTSAVPNINGEPKWARSAIDSILTNEKYCGDVLLQKTYIDDCINKKVKKNTGQLPMYLVQNHHEGIISRETFDAAQAELARRSAGKSPSKKNAPTGRSRYSSKYALSDSRFCFVWICYIGIVIAYEDKRHICVDIIYSHLKGVSRKVVDAVNHVLVIAVSSVVFYAGVLYFRRAVTNHSAATNTNMGVVVIGLPLMALCLIAIELMDMYKQYIKKEGNVK